MTTITFTGTDIGTLTAFLVNAVKLGQEGALATAPVAGLLQASAEVRRLQEMIAAELTARG